MNWYFWETNMLIRLREEDSCSSMHWSQIIREIYISIFYQYCVAQLRLLYRNKFFCNIFLSKGIQRRFQYWRWFSGWHWWCWWWKDSRLPVILLFPHSTHCGLVVLGAMETEKPALVTSKQAAKATVLLWNRMSL